MRAQCAPNQNFIVSAEITVVLKEKDRMEAVKLFDKKKAPVDWVTESLYISFGKPRPAELRHGGVPR